MHIYSLPELSSQSYSRKYEKLPDTSIRAFLKNTEKRLRYKSVGLTFDALR